MLAVCNDAGLNSCNIYINHTFLTPVIHKDPEKLELRDCIGPLISVSKPCSQRWPSHERKRFKIKGMLHQNKLTHGSAVNAAKLCLRLCVALKTLDMEVMLKILEESGRALIIYTRRAAALRLRAPVHHVSSCC